MNITGLITEYNPFHNGHSFHIKESKKICKSDGIVCVMSGNFMQRGIPAIVDKWSRTEMALKNGVDLVIELPAIFSVSSAEFFSYGAVSILNSTNVVNNICFGSECGNIDILNSIAQVLVNENNSFKKLLKENLNEGLSFPLARQKSLISYFNNDDYKEILSSPNNILGIEYCKNILKLNSKIIPKTIKRTGSGYNDENAYSSLASATSIRKLIKDDNINRCENLMPKSSFEILCSKFNNGISIPDMNLMFNLIKYKLLSGYSNINLIPDVSEGLDNKILNEIKLSSSYDDLLFRIKSKRYTLTRISRILCQIYLSFEQYDINMIRKSEPSYLRVLGFNSTGQKILKMIKNNSSCEIITKMPKSNLNKMMELDIHATNMYSLISNSIPYAADYFISPIIIK